MLFISFVFYKPISQEDWTYDDYQLIEILDGGATEYAQNKAHTDWHDMVSKLNTHAVTRTNFDQYVIIPPSKGGKQEAYACGT
jgi:hypothetical protein